MLNRFKTITSLALFVVISLVFVGCSKQQVEPLNLTYYLENEVHFNLYGTNNYNSNTLTLKNFTETSDDLIMNKYTVIQFNTKKDWTYGLYLERIEFDVCLSHDCDVDIDLTISNLENAENYNSEQDVNFYYKSISVSNKLTHISLDINDTFNNKTATFSFEINQSCFSNASLTWTISGLKFFGKHIENNY